jgi:hypothetical protein
MTDRHPFAASGALEKQLGALLDQYDEARRNTQTRKDQARDDEQRFFEEFAALRANLLRPLFEAVGAMLVQRGHAFTIREQEFAPQSGGAGAEASIALYVAPEGMEKPAASDEHLRALSFTTRHYNKTVSVRNGAAPHEGTQAGAKGAYALARIDLELAEAELVKLMAAIVKV